MCLYVLASFRIIWRARKSYIVGIIISSTPKWKRNRLNTHIQFSLFQFSPVGFNQITHWNCVTSILVAIAKLYAQFRTSCMYRSIDGVSLIWIECCRPAQSFCKWPVFWFNCLIAFRMVSLLMLCGRNKEQNLLRMRLKEKKKWVFTAGKSAVNSATAVRMRSAPGTNTSFEVISCITDHSSWMRRVTTSVRCLTSSECGNGPHPLVVADAAVGWSAPVSSVVADFCACSSLIWYILFAVRLSCCCACDFVACGPSRVSYILTGRLL